MNLPELNYADVSEKIINFINQQVKAFDRDGVVIGISGGVDSSVIAKLCVEALGKEKVLGLIMPEKDSHPHTKTDAQKFGQWLGIKTKYINMSSPLNKLGCYSLFPFATMLPYNLRARYALAKHDSFLKKTGKYAFVRTLLSTKDKELRPAVAYYRMKHRIRMIMLYKHAELNNLLVVGTSNKSEIMVGYFTKFGDGAVDIEPIQGLYKTQIFQLANYLKIPEYIINKKPSPDFVPGITDESSIGLTYKKLDLILYCIDKKMPENEIIKNLGASIKDIEYVRELISKSKHMREPIPTLDIG